MFLSKSSSGIWQLYYNNSLGKRTKVSTKTKIKSEALAFLKTFNLDRQPANKSVRFTEFITDFHQYTKSNYTQGNIVLYERAFRNFQLFFGNIILRSITPQHSEKYKVERLKTSAPVTVNIELRCLRSALNIAKRWNLVESNPFSSLKQCPVPEKSPTFFSKGNLRLLVDSIKVQWLKEIVLFAVMTGMRESEILHIRWQDIDFKRKIIAIQSNNSFRTKNGKNRFIPMNKTLYSLLKNKSKYKTSDYIFTLDGGLIKRERVSVRFKREIKKAGIKDSSLHFHSLRHTFASWLVQAGVSLYEVQKLLGHSSPIVTQIYSHLAPEQMHSTVNRISIGRNLILKERK